MPIWDQFEQVSKNNLSWLKVTKIACDVEQNKCKSENVSGYPTIIYYKNNNKIAEFSETRTVDNLISFVNKYK